MLKYVNSEIVFQEIPDETTLAINISNCPCHCKGCHSAYLADDIGLELNWHSCEGRKDKSIGLHKLLHSNKGITCVCFMGGDNDPRSINRLAKNIQWLNKHIRKPLWEPIKVAWYSGGQGLSPLIDLANFNYIKLGPYIEEFGALNKPTTNQRLYEINKNEFHNSIYRLKDITYKFWKNNLG